ncbi:MAG: DUF998 domain-containing protein [Cytophagales bacterium]|nr:DUF998 domain-containing protein [Cytophagales bacterium]
MKERLSKGMRIDWPLVATISLSFLLYGEFLGNAYLGTLFSGYNWKTDSISYLGQENSPILHYVQIWGACFTILYIILGVAFYFSFNRPSIFVKIVSILFIIYGLGEGLGSSFFPVNVKGTELTESAFLHNIFGGFADVALYTIPVLMLFEFSKDKNKEFHQVTYVLMAVAVVSCSIFLIAKYFHIEHGLFTYRGLWQRIFLLCFYLFFYLLLRKLPKTY